MVKDELSHASPFLSKFLYVRQVSCFIASLLWELYAMQPNSEYMNFRMSTELDQSWVSKTDLLRFLRCPYAFYVLDKGLIEFQDTIDEHQATIIEQGFAFQSSIEAEAKPLPQSIELSQLFSEESVRVFSQKLPLLKNVELKITGRPDAVDTQKGELVPLEIKSHKATRVSDELELAFYWMLLEPYRTKKSPPRGYLLLRHNGEPKEVEIELRPAHFEKVQRLFREIHNARENGVRPRVCGCPVCSGPMVDEIQYFTRARKDLTLIWGIGRIYAQCLEDFGILTYDQILNADSAAIIETLSKHNYHLSIAQVDRWKHHATSYSTGRAIVFGEPMLPDDSYLVLDLEYDPESSIWLVGICLVRSFGIDYFAFWADSPSEEKSILDKLHNLVLANPSLPILTWSGTSADLPALRKASERARLSNLLNMVESKHVDLFQRTLTSVRFPTKSLSIDEVARFFSIPRLSSIGSGLEAQMIYRRYCNSRDENERSQLKDRLIEYNRDDLAAVIGIKERLVELCKERLHGV